MKTRTLSITIDNFYQELSQQDRNIDFLVKGVFPPVIRLHRATSAYKIIFSFHKYILSNEICPQKRENVYRVHFTREFIRISFDVVLTLTDTF